MWSQSCGGSPKSSPITRVGSGDGDLVDELDLASLARLGHDRPADVAHPILDRADHAGAEVQ